MRLMQLVDGHVDFAFLRGRIVRRPHAIEGNNKCTEEKIWLFDEHQRLAQTDNEYLCCHLASIGINTFFHILNYPPKQLSSCRYSTTVNVLASRPCRM